MGYFDPPVDLAPVYAAIASVQTAMPTAATSTPAAIATSGIVGSDQSQFARADHVHPSKVRSDRLQCAADGTLTWTYPTAFAAGTLPRIQAIVETSMGVTDVLNAQIEGTPTATSCQIRVTRTQRSTVSLIGLTVLSIPSSVGVQWVHLSAFG